MIWERFDLVTRNDNRAEHAFTLVELLCVIALLGMITMIAVPAAQDLGHKRNLEIAARTLATDMRKCQQTAITSGTEYYMEFLLYYEVYNYRIKNLQNSLIEKIKFPEGVSYRSTTIRPVGGIPRLSFKPNGSPNWGGTVALHNTAGDVLYVIITPATGRVRISEDPPDHWDVHALP